MYLYDNLTMKWEFNNKKYIAVINRDDCDESPREWSNVATMACFHTRYNLGDKIGTDDPDEFWRGLVGKFASRRNVYDAVMEGLLDDVRVTQNDNHCTSFDVAVNDDYNHCFVAHGNLTATEMIDAVLDNLTIADCQTLLEPHVEWLPLYLYDHGDITISTGSFGDPWDSGQVGWICASREAVLKETHATEDNWREVAERSMRNEVETYDAFLRGEVYGYTVYEIPEDVDDDDANEYNCEELDSCWGFYGDNTDNGIIDAIGYGLSEAIQNDAVEYGEVKRCNYRRF